MRVEACNALVLPAEEEVRDVVKRMLLACDVFEPPTPVERLLAYARLTTEERDDLVPGPMTQLMQRAGRAFWRAVGGRVLGLLDLEQRHIMIDHGLHPHRQEFLLFHEIAHDALPWHHALFVATSEWSLRPTVRRVFEAEANYFAGHSIFQLGDMARVQRGRRLKMSELGALATRYGASLTATARQYVLVQDLPVALFVGQAVGIAPTRGIAFRYALGNAAFLREFGPEVWVDQLPPTDSVCSVLNVPGCAVSEVEVNLVDLRGEQRPLSVETLYNSYNTLTLLHPTGGQQRPPKWLSRRTSHARL